MKLIIHTGRGNYPVFIGYKNIASINHYFKLRNYSKTCFIIDSKVSDINPSISSLLKISKFRIMIDLQEKNKNISSVKKIWSYLKHNNFDRKSLLICIGGGLTLDVGGFAAGTYMRGIAFINIPTSLLAQVDAAIGGKTGINFDNTKNMIGIFNNPLAVIIDTDLLHTLPDRQLISGFAELIKYGVIMDRRLFLRVTSRKPFQYTKKEITAFISRACTLKKLIVESDTYETGERKLLNFGHTVGHALESSSQKNPDPLLHGEAVGIGMIAESYLSYKMGVLPGSDFADICSAIKNAGLPDNMSGMVYDDILNLMLSDKKNNKNIIKWSLPIKIGSGKYDVVAPENLIKDAINYVSR